MPTDAGRASRLFSVAFGPARRHSALAVGAFSATTMITTRSSTPEDAEAVSACVDAVSRERRYLGATSGFSAEQTRAFISSLSDSGGIQIVAIAETKIVGWCDVTPHPFEGMRHVGRLGMGLLPPFRGQGLGHRLVREVLSHVFAKTVNRVELEVFASNKIAIRLYEREGFVIEGRKRLARFLDGAWDDLLIMGCLRDEWLIPPPNKPATGNAGRVPHLATKRHRPRRA